MTDIRFDDLRRTTIELRVDEKIKRSEPRELIEPLRAHLELGMPVSIPLTSHLPGIKDDLRNFIDQSPIGTAYHLVYLTCDFLPRDEDRIVEAWLQVQLATEAGGAAIAWSMEPLRLGRRAEIKQKAKLGADAKILSASVDAEAKFEVKDYYIMAHGQLRADPLWHFRELETEPLEGVHELMMVVRVTGAAAASGTLQVWASVRRKHLRLIPYRAALENAPHATFRLGGA